jgi:membrane-associated protein
LEHVIGFWHIISHLDSSLVEMSKTMGPWLYVLLFAIIFCETGLVVTPFLPGDSLLFAVGVLCRLGGMSIVVILPMLLLAAVLGDASNYTIGNLVGPKVFTSSTSKLLNREHLLKTQAFYDKYGGKTIIIARFIPIVRTFAPFVAGIGKMQYKKFFSFNVIGAVAWVCSIMPLGYAFANLPFVKKNFHVVIFAIIAISVLPAVIEYLRERARLAKAAS